jgi:hypothetical protein
MDTDRRDAYEAAALVCGVCAAFACSTVIEDVSYAGRLAEDAIIRADAFCYRDKGHQAIEDAAAIQARAAVSAALRDSWAVAARRFLRAARLVEVETQNAD